jgi:hypothetical protein
MMQTYILCTHIALSSVSLLSSFFSASANTPYDFVMAHNTLLLTSVYREKINGLEPRKMK